MPSLSTRARCKAALGARLPGLAEQEDLTDWLADEVLDAGAWASAESLQVGARSGPGPTANSTTSPC